MPPFLGLATAGGKILDVPTIEEPMRVVQQLDAIARGLFGLGLDAHAVTTLTRRVALDSMPAARHAVLAALATGEVLTTAGVARVAGVDRKVARFALEDLATVGVVCSDRSDDDEAEEPVGTVTWALDGDDGALIADVFAGHGLSGGWDEMWVPIPPPPQEGEGYGGATNVSSHPPEPAAALSLVGDTGNSPPQPAEPDCLRKPPPPERRSAP